MNRVGKEMLWKNLQELQPKERRGDFYYEHKDKVKVLFWVAVSSIGIFTLEAIAREIAMKLAGR